MCAIIFLLLSSSENGKRNKPGWLMHQGDVDLREGIYKQRERRRNSERTNILDNMAVYYNLIMIPHPRGDEDTRVVTTQLNAGIIEKLQNSNPRFIKHVNILTLPICLVQAALLIMTSRLIFSVLKRLFLRIKSLPLETYSYRVTYVLGYIYSSTHLCLQLHVCVSSFCAQLSHYRVPFFFPTKTFLFRFVTSAYLVRPELGTEAIWKFTKNQATRFKNPARSQRKEHM